MARIFNLTFSARDALRLGTFWIDNGVPVPRQANGIEWFVLTDPEGNEFCVGGEP